MEVGTCEIEITLWFRPPRVDRRHVGDKRIHWRFAHGEVAAMEGSAPDSCLPHESPLGRTVAGSIQFNHIVRMAERAHGLATWG